MIQPLGSWGGTKTTLDIPVLYIIYTYTKSPHWMFGKGKLFWLIQVIPGIVLVPLGDPFLSISSRCWRSWGGIYQCWQVRRLSKRNTCDETGTSACLGSWNLDYPLVIRTIDDFYIAPKTGILVLSRPVTELNLPLFLPGSLWYYKWVLHRDRVPQNCRTNYGAQPLSTWDLWHEPH